MASDSRTLEILLEARDNASKVVNQVSDSVSSFGKNTVGQLKNAKIALAAGLAATTAFAVTSVQAFMESEDAVFGLNAALNNLANTGDNITGVQERVLEFASSLQSMSRFSDEAIVSASTLMLRLGVGTETIQEATQATVDMAAAMQLDLGAAAQAVGLALSYPAEALGRLRRQGIIFTDDQEKMIKGMVDVGKTAEAQRFILDELSDRFSGTASQSAKTFGGQLDVLKNTVNDIQETLGKGFVETLLNLVGGIDNVSARLAEFNTWLQSHQEVVAAIVIAVSTLAVVFGVLLAGALIAAAGTVTLIVAGIALLVGVIVGAAVVIAHHWEGIVFMFQEAANNIVLSVQLMWGAITTFITDIIAGIAGFITSVSTAWSEFWLSTLPFSIGYFIGWISVAIPQMIANFIMWMAVLPIKVALIFTDLVTKAIALLTQLWTWITTNVSSWPGKVQAFLSTLPGIAEEIFIKMQKAIQTKIDEMWQGIKDFGDKVIGVWNSIKDAISGAVSKAAEGVKAGVKGFTSRQFGGFVPQTGLVLLHEGEFVLSKDMQAGRSPVPTGVQQTFNQPITINPTLSGEPDFDLLGYKLAWILRNTR